MQKRSSRWKGCEFPIECCEKSLLPPALSNLPIVSSFGADVLLEGVLGEAVEGERGHGAFEMRCRDAQGAVGATPAGEIVTFDPDQAFIHTSTFCVRL